MTISYFRVILVIDKIKFKKESEVVKMEIHKIFMSLKNRNVEAKKLKADGYKVIVHTSTNQQLHPQYVEDYPYQDVKNDNGFGNTVYKTFFKSLYIVEAEKMY